MACDCNFCKLCRAFKEYALERNNKGNHISLIDENTKAIFGKGTFEGLDDVEQDFLVALIIRGLTLSVAEATNNREDSGVHVPGFVPVEIPGCANMKQEDYINSVKNCRNN